MANYEVIEAALKLVADSAGGLEQILLGTPGSTVVYPNILGPEGDGLNREYATGRMWEGNLLPPLLTQIAAVLDALESRIYALEHPSP